ncbi:hypothetical protein C8R47DRAFT_1204548, partial [Mycena vitilis]
MDLEDWGEANGENVMVKDVAILSLTSPTEIWDLEDTASDVGRMRVPASDGALERGGEANTETADAQESEGGDGGKEERRRRGRSMLGAVVDGRCSEPIAGRQSVSPQIPASSVRLGPLEYVVVPLTLGSSKHLIHAKVFVILEKEVPRWFRDTSYLIHRPPETFRDTHSRPPTFIDPQRLGKTHKSRPQLSHPANINPSPTSSKTRRRTARICPAFVDSIAPFPAEIPFDSGSGPAPKSLPEITCQRSFLKNLKEAQINEIRQVSNASGGARLITRRNEVGTGRDTYLYAGVLEIRERMPVRIVHMFKKRDYEVPMTPPESNGHLFNVCQRFIENRRVPALWVDEYVHGRLNLQIFVLMLHDKPAYLWTYIHRRLVEAMRQTLIRREKKSSQRMDDPSPNPDAWRLADRPMHIELARIWEARYDDVDYGGRLSVLDARARLTETTIERGFKSSIRSAIRKEWFERRTLHRRYDEDGQDIKATP